MITEPEATEEYEMAEEIIFSVQESPEGGYEARALSAPIFTEADTLKELRSAVRDATECHFEKGECPKLNLLISPPHRCSPLHLPLTETSPAVPGPPEY